MHSKPCNFILKTCRTPHFLAFIAILALTTAKGFGQTPSTNIEVTSSPKQPAVARIGVTLSGLELEDAFQRQSKSRGLNPSVFRQKVMDALTEIHPGTIRMEFPDLGQQLATKLSVSGAATSGSSSSESEYGLGEFLQLCAETGADPWLRIPSSTTPEQMRELVEYLSGTGSDEWSAARIATGQYEPWTEVFGKIHVELGNESGSVVTVSETMAAASYAARATEDFDAARQTAGFDGSKFDLMVSGTGATPEWTAAVLAKSPKQDSVAITADLPWSSAGAPSADLLGSLLAEPEAMDAAGGVVSSEVTALARGTTVNLGRSQLSPASGRSQQPTQAWGASLAQIEHLLQMMAMGVRYQNGIVLSDSSLGCASQSGDCHSAQFLSEVLANGVIGGTMLQTIQTGANPSLSQVLSSQSAQAHALQSFAFSDGEKVSLVVFNMSTSATLPVTLSGQNAPAGDVQMVQVAPSTITAVGRDLQPSTQTVSSADLISGYSLPPYSMTVLSWESSAGVQTTHATPGTSKVPNATANRYASPTLTAQSAASGSMNSSQTIIDCPSGWSASSSSACGVSTTSQTTGFPFAWFGGTASGTGPSGTNFILQPAGSIHTSNSLVYQTPVNVQAFTTTYQYQGNAWNLAFVLQNVTHNAGAGPAPGFTLAQSFDGGAGCEGGFYQAFGPNGAPPANNIFVLNLDSANLLVNSEAPFFSNAQIYQQMQSPCIPDDNQPYYYPTNKVSTSPVPMSEISGSVCTPVLNGSCVPAGDSSSPDTFSATIIYTGSALTLNLYDVTAGGTCSPVTSSTCFSYTWPNVSIPTLVNGTTAYAGFGTSSNANTPSALTIKNWVYTVLSPASTPIFSPAAGTYSSAQTVSISAPSGSIICYNTTGAPATNGTTGCLPGSTLYTGAISVTSGQTIYAVAGGTGYGDSPTASAAYQISSTAAQPTFFPSAGTYQGNQTVILTAAQGSVICWNNTGSPAVNAAGTGCTTGTLYSAPITVSSNETLYAVSGGAGLTSSSIGSAAYVISPFAVVDGYTGSYPANSPTFSPLPGTYSGTQNVTLSSTTAKSYICYLVSSTTPTLLPEPDSLGGCSVGTLYSGPVSVSSSETIYAAAGTVVGANVAGTGPPSSVSSGTYQVGATQSPTATPVYSIAAGTYATPQTVSISDATSGATIYYTTNGTTPTTSSSVYSGPITVSSTETLEAIAVASGYSNSAVATATYTINSVVPAPTFSPAGGTYTTTQTVTISDTTAGTAIYYTTNGTTPTTASTLYTGPITVSSTETLEAIAVATGDANSVGTATYTIMPVLPAPSFSVAGGTYTSAQSVSISDATSGTTIYYTTNGTTPTTSSTVYSGAITVSSSETLKAIAVKTGYTNSSVTSAAYTLNTSTTGTPVGGSTSGTAYINYPSGAFQSQVFDLNGGATVTSGKVLQLTDGNLQEGRSIWFSTRVPVQQFTTDFTFQQLNATADGMTFTIQGEGSTAVGGTGGSLGYMGITKSVAVKFDLYSNDGEGTDSTGLYTDGAAPTMPSVNLSSTGVVLRSGDVMHAHMVYNGTTLTMTLTDTVTNATVTEVFTVNIPSIVGGNTAYVGFTGGTGGKTAIQNVLSWTYTVPTEQAAATPTFSVAAGTYTTAQTVSISDTTSGATIYYTTNGTTPTTSSNKYTGAITVSASETLEAIAVVSGYTNSSVATAAYTINASAAAIAAPAFSPASGTYSTTQSVTISDATAGATIYYTTDGSTPTTSSKKYTGALAVTASQTLKAIAVKSGVSQYPVATAAYTIAPVLPAPAFSKAAGTYTSAQSVTISDAASGASIYYTTNGSTPTTSSTKYIGAITITADETLKAIAVESGHTNSPVVSAAYTIAPVLPAPTFSKAAGTYTSAQTITISDATSESSIYYTTNGSTPTTSSAKYSRAITVSANETLKAIAVESGHTNSPVVSAAYAIALVLPAPTFSKAAGTYTSAQTITIKDATGGTSIYYTTNGATPTTSSVKYYNPITVTANETLKAIAVETGHANSPVASAAYTIKLTTAAAIPGTK